MKFSKILRRTLLRAFWPSRIFTAIRLQKRRRKTGKTYDDPQIQLYSEFLNNDMMHYGYFDDVDMRPEHISIADIEQAQVRYTDLFLDHLTNKKDPVLDVGCGMGGLANMLVNKGFRVDALTPDRHQVKYIAGKYPGINVIRSKYQDFPDPKPGYGTIIHAESFQYIRLNMIVKMTERLLIPGGKWLVCDYFRIEKSHERSGHYWDDFLDELGKSGLKITHQQDITDHILPTMKYIHMIANRFLLPTGDYLLEKFRIKQPGLFYLTREIAGFIPPRLEYWAEMVNPERYRKEKKYMFLILERS